MSGSTGEWVSSYEDALRINYLESLGGVDWNEAPTPPKRHDCTPQTRGYMDRSPVERCACGGISFGDGFWMERNRRSGAPPEPERRRFSLRRKTKGA